MKCNLLTDISAAYKAFKLARQIRENGHQPVVETRSAVPVLKGGPGLLDVMEGLSTVQRLAWDDARIVMAAFRSQPYDVRHSWAFTPKAGSYVFRAKAWKAFLLPLLGPHKTSKAMADVLAWYRHVIQMDESAKEVST